MCEASVPLGMERKPVPARSSLGCPSLCVFKGSPPGAPQRAPPTESVMQGCRGAVCSSAPLRKPQLAAKARAAAGSQSEAQAGCGLVAAGPTTLTPR